MSVVTEGELVLDQNETAEFVRNIIHPNIEALRRRDAFLSDRDDIVIHFSGEEIVAECDSVCVHFESALNRSLTHDKRRSY